MAVGFGAGWAVFERPWESDPKPPTRFTAASIEGVTGSVLAPRVRDVSCSRVHGPFYSCRAYTSANGERTTRSRSRPTVDASRLGSSLRRPWSVSNVADPAALK